MMSDSRDIDGLGQDILSPYIVESFDIGEVDGHAEASR
jgi:hypothetical protein